MKKFMSLTITTVLTAFIFAISLVGCASGEYKNTKKGTAIGAGAGAVAGAIIGNQSGSTENGALIGGVLGGAAGSIIGNRMDKQAQELDRIAETKRTEEGLITKLRSDILFDTGKAELKPAVKENLQKIGAIMKNYPENILTVKGYTDATGSEKMNEVLSKQRASAVKDVLVANSVPASTITVRGLGEDSPVADNNTDKGRSLNRRVEIEVAADASKVPDSAVK